MFKVGFIGTGVIFDLNVLGYLNNQDVEIVSLCNRSKEKAYQKKEKFNLNNEVTIYSDYLKMLDDEQLDIVEILTPHHLHAEMTINTAREGIKAISVQKPIALTLKEADEMIAACKKSNTLLSVIENFYFIPHLIKAKQLIDDAYIGDPTSIRIKTAIGTYGGWKIPENAKKWREDPSKVGGRKEGSPVLLDNGWHAFSLASWFLGEKIEKVFAWTDNFQGIDAPAYVMFKYEQSKEHVVPQYGHMEFTLMPEATIPSKYYPTDEFIEVIATRGIMRINQGTSLGNLMSKSEIFSPIVLIRDGNVETYDDFRKDWKISFINSTHHFIESVKENKSPILSGEKAKEILKFNLAAVKSAEEGTEIMLN